MKKISKWPRFAVLCAASLLALAVYRSAAQNLQFNQVKFVTALEMVPTGKVWKVESCANTGGVIQNSSQRIKINGTDVWIYDCEGNGRCYDFTRMPFWLPEGNSLEPVFNVLGISVIEFNVTP